MTLVLLDAKKHNRKKFDCGVEALNNYLKLMANQQSKKDNSRTYILEDTQNDKTIIGFYTLSMIKVELSNFSPNLQKKYQKNYIAGVIARLAIDKKYQNKRYGQYLLIDALKKLLLASDTIGFPLIVVDAKEGASSFYKTFGFNEFEEEKNKLFITVSEVRNNFKTLEGD